MTPLWPYNGGLWGRRVDRRSLYVDSAPETLKPRLSFGIICSNPSRRHERGRGFLESSYLNGLNGLLFMLSVLRLRQSCPLKRVMPTAEKSLASRSSPSASFSPDESFSWGHRQHFSMAHTLLAISVACMLGLFAIYLSYRNSAQT